MNGNLKEEERVLKSETVITSIDDIYKRKEEFKSKEINFLFQRLSEKRGATILSFVEKEDTSYAVFLEQKIKYNMTIIDMTYTIQIRNALSSKFKYGGCLWVYPIFDGKTQLGIGEFKIKDIVIKESGLGHGSILMEHFLEFCNKNRVKRIWGEFSFVDNTDERRDIRTAFYNKHGFTIKDDIVEKILY